MVQMDSNLPGHNVESQTEGAEDHKGLIQADIGDSSGNLWNSIHVGKREDALVPKGGS